MDAEELESLERARLRALVAADLEAAQRLHASDYQLITPGGGSLTKDEYLGLISSSEFRYRTFEPASPVTIRMHRDVGIARYQAQIVVVDGHGTNELDAGLFWHTDVWERRADGWQAVWSQATRIRLEDPED